MLIPLNGSEIAGERGGGGESGGDVGGGGRVVVGGRGGGGSIRHTTDGWWEERGGGGRRRSRVMGLIFAERIIKRYYHNGPVIQPACTQRSQPSHVCFTRREGGRNEGGERAERSTY